MSTFGAMLILHYGLGWQFPDWLYFIALFGLMTRLDKMGEKK